MEKSPLDIALERIEECKRARAAGLDLADLGLDHLPAEIAELTWLEELALGYSISEGTFRTNEITDITPLAALTNLQTLDCAGNQITDLAPLKTLTNLKTLDCSNNPITDLIPLAALTSLQTLNCTVNQITDIAPLKTLTNLKILDCSNNPITDLTPLAALTNLRVLQCFNNQITDLTPLAALTNLRVLQCFNNQITDLAPLAALTNLQTLNCSRNQITDLAPLAALTNLQTLNCSRNQITGLAPLAALTNLQTLNCSRNQITGLAPLAALTNLQKLTCFNNKITDLAPLRPLLLQEQLRHLYVSNNPIQGIPAAILNEDNCAEALRAYWQDLAKGAANKRAIKVVLVGNGRVGKSTLAYALQHKRAPSEAFSVTHGIVIEQIPFQLEGDPEPLTLHLWDFGGQEIYHATHRLFLAKDSLYLLLWAEETEEHPDETRHPVSYWLEAIHDLAPNSPIILVKNQIDRADQLLGCPEDLLPESPGVKQISQYVKVSALQYRHLPALRGAMASVLEELQPRLCMALPTAWLAVEAELTRLRSQPSIPFAHFEQLCRKHGVSHPFWFADYLHKTGVIFYREGTFHNQVILDQNWIINAVYRVFDPKLPHRRRIERMGGRFSGEDASLIWQEADDAEQEIYLDFMHNSGICYEPKRWENRWQKKPLAEREFIVPALLPRSSSAQQAWGQPQPDDWLLEVQFPFLHRSIVERLILRLGETYGGKPWYSGIFCETEFGQVLLTCHYTNQATSNAGSLHFHLRGTQLQNLLGALRKLLANVSPHRRYQEWLERDGEKQQLDEFREAEAEHISQLDNSATNGKEVKLFISYAHEDEAHKDTLKKHLKAIQREYALTVWDDRALFAGEPVEEQIFRQLNTADIIALLISPDFIKSDYCFTKEMERALQRYEQEGNVVIPIIVRHTASWRNHVGKITALPTDAKPLKKWDDPDEFWGDVETGIRAQVQKLLIEKKS